VLSAAQPRRLRRGGSALLCTHMLKRCCSFSSALMPLLIPLFGCAWDSNIESRTAVTRLRGRNKMKPRQNLRSSTIKTLQSRAGSVQQQVFETVCQRSPGWQPLQVTLHYERQAEPHSPVGSRAATKSAFPSCLMSGMAKGFCMRPTSTSARGEGWKAQLGWASGSCNGKLCVRVLSFKAPNQMARWLRTNVQDRVALQQHSSVLMASAALQRQPWQCD
jgi:hypothetical protein